MIEIIEVMPVRTTTINGMEVDVIEHRREVTWKSSTVASVKRDINRRFRRQTRQMLRAAGY